MTSRLKVFWVIDVGSGESAEPVLAYDKAGAAAKANRLFGGTDEEPCDLKIYAAEDAIKSEKIREQLKLYQELADEACAMAEELAQERDLAFMQSEIEKRWGSSEYGDAFLARKDPQRDAHHAALCIGKALGKLFWMLDDADHRDTDRVASVFEKHDLDKVIADIVICALRVGSRWPRNPINVAAAVKWRIDNQFRPQPASAPIAGLGNRALVPADESKG
jgi:hypothetical protein